MSSEIYTQSLYDKLDKDKLKRSLEDSLQQISQGKRDITFSFEGIEISFSDEDEEINIVV